MFDLIKYILGSLQGLSQAKRAKICAYWLAPGTVLLWTASGVVDGNFLINVTQPVAISELRSEISLSGEVMQRPGFALIIEPNASEFVIPLESPVLSIWTSLEEAAAKINGDRLILDTGHIKSKAPFFGVTNPVTVVVESQLGKEVQTPGGKEKIDDLQLRSKRSISVVTSVLLACVFAFGISAAGLPLPDSKKHSSA